MSRPRSESGPILNWSSPDPNSDLGWTNLELGPNFDLGQTDFELGQTNFKQGRE